MHLEESCKVTVQILGSEALYPEHIEIDCRDNDGNELTLRFLDESIVAKT
jgi:ribonuclease E